MSQATLPGGLVVQYTYNGDGLKIRRIEGSAVTRYYHDGIRPLYETKADGSRNADLERDIFGNLLARQDAGGTRYYYHHDGLGSTVGLTDASGAVAAQRAYDAWGNRRTSSGSAPPGSYQFTGAELDPTSGLYHMGARFYDPTIGRWLGEDPVKGTSPRALNFYAYVGNNPLIFSDPSGTCDQKCLEELNAQRQALALAASNTSNPVGSYLAALAMAEAVGSALGKDKGHAAARIFLGKVQGGADLATAFSDTLTEVLKDQPSRTQIGVRYYVGALAASTGLGLMAVGAGMILAGRRTGNVDLILRGSALAATGAILFELGLITINVARQDDVEYHGGQVLNSLDPVVRAFIRLLLRL